MVLTKLSGIRKSYICLVSSHCSNYRPVRRTRFIQNLCNPLLSLPHLSRVYIFLLFPKNHHLNKYVIPLEETNYNEGKHLLLNCYVYNEDGEVNRKEESPFSF